MTTYRKQIEVSDTGSVYASVYAEGGRRVGLKFFNSSFFSFYFGGPSGIEKLCVKAHKWADEYIAMCERQEVMPKPKSTKQLLAEIDWKITSEGRMP
jgi:hypothetical protein